MSSGRISVILAPILAEDGPAGNVIIPPIVAASLYSQSCTDPFFHWRLLLSSPKDLINERWERRCSSVGEITDFNIGGLSITFVHTFPIITP